MLTNFFLKKKTGPRLSPLARTLLRLADINMSSANCTLLPADEENSEPEDLGRAMFFKTDGKLLIRDRAIYITTPDGIKAENQDQFHGSGDTLSLWFLYEHVPRTIECRIDERVHFPPELAATLDPKASIGYKLTPTSDILKQDKRTSLRFSHLPGQGILPVYPQVLFDLHVHRTDQTFPEEGAIPPSIENLRIITHQKDDAEKGAFLAENLVPIFKKAIRANASENRNVRTLMHSRREEGFRVELCDFSVNGARFMTPPNFLTYMLGKNHNQDLLEEQINLLKTRVLQLNFYSRLRFNRDTEPYRPELPRRISILAKIVRCVVEWEDEEEQIGGQIVQAGAKIMYDPVAYDREAYQ